MATIHQSLGRMSEAISYYHQSLLKHSAANNQRGLVYCYNNIGAVHETQGRPDSALIYYEKAALLAQHVGLQDMAGTGYSNMANVYAETGKVGEAIDMMYRSMAIQEAANNASGVAQCLSQISDLRSALGEKADALAFMRRAYDL
ncbi:MAG: tetratricopeptide repeat protein [Flavobacteriales bacterium]|nr:tetratricopeptide repeat protein [Flavobacteriales bacterium]